MHWSFKFIFSYQHDYEYDLEKKKVLNSFVKSLRDTFWSERSKEPLSFLTRTRYYYDHEVSNMVFLILLGVKSCVNDQDTKEIFDSQGFSSSCDDLKSTMSSWMTDDVAFEGLILRALEKISKGIPLSQSQ